MINKQFNDYSSLIMPVPILNSLNPFLLRADSDFLKDLNMTSLFLLSLLKDDNNNNNISLLKFRDNVCNYQSPYFDITLADATNILALSK